MASLDRMEDDLVEDVFLQEGHCPTIAEHAVRCNSLFREYMIIPEIVPDPTIMDDQLARFTLWASNMDVYGPLNVSLDYRLRFSPTVVEIIHQLLDVICDTLTSLKPINEPPKSPSKKRRRISGYSSSEVTRRDDDDESDSDSCENQMEENISKITDTIGGTVSRLFRMSNAVRKSAKANRARKIENYRENEEANTAITELRSYTECYIRFRFPMAPDSLRSALVEANALRLRRLYYQRTHRRRIQLSVQNPQTSTLGVPLPKAKEKFLAVRFDSSVLSEPAAIRKLSGPASPPPVPITNATTARQTAVEAFYAKASIEMPGPKSALVNNNLSFPPIPPTQECPYCGVIIEFKNKKLWDNHVIGDLEPFICVFSACLDRGQHETSPLTFESSKAWISHMQNAHGHTWECRAPSHNPITFDQETKYQQHSIQEHGVPETHAGVLSNAARRPNLDKMLECPFGDDFRSPGEVEPSAVFASEALQLHVAAHIKEIALLTLQKLSGDGDENAENVGSDQPLSDNGPGYMNRRESMYSILDDGDLDLLNDPDPKMTLIHELAVEDRLTEYLKKKWEGKDHEFWPTLEEIAKHNANSDTWTMGKTYWKELDVWNYDYCSQDERQDAINNAIRQYDKMRLSASAAVWQKLLPREDRGKGICLSRLQANLANVPPPPVAHSDSDQEIDDTYKALTAHILESNYDSEMTRLHHAVQAGDLRLVKTLISEGVDLGSRDKRGRTALYYAFMGKTPDPHLLTLLLGAGSKAFINLGDDSGQTALHYAAGRGFLDGMKILVNNGGDIKTTDNYGFSPFLWAVVAGQISAIDMLLKMGADINSTSVDGKSALAWASSLRRYSIVQLLMGYGASMSGTRNKQMVVLEVAAASGDIDIVKLLLDHGEDPNYRDLDGWSAIHWAAEEGHLDIVRLLLDQGADVNAVSSYGTSPLHCAANGGNAFIVSLLLQHGADPLRSTRHGWTALHHAAFMGHSQVVRLLLKDDRVRSSASQQDINGWSVLHLAVLGRDLATLNVLIQESVIVESRALSDESGLTAEEWLHLSPASHFYKATSNLAFSKSRCCRSVTGLRQAAILGNVPMIKLLISLGHDVNDTDSGNRTALYYAAKKHVLSTIDLLLDRGADPKILPAGRRTWEEFISNDSVLRRLKYGGRENISLLGTTEVDESKYSALFGATFRSAFQDRPVSSESETSARPSWWLSRTMSSEAQAGSLKSWSGSSTDAVHDPPPPVVYSFTNLSNRNVPDDSAPAPAPQTKDNKRKSVRSRATYFLKRLVGE